MKLSLADLSCGLLASIWRLQLLTPGSLASAWPQHAQMLCYCRGLLQAAAALQSPYCSLPVSASGGSVKPSRRCAGWSKRKSQPEPSEAAALHLRMLLQ